MSPDRHNHHIVIIPTLGDTGKACAPLAKRLEAEGLTVNLFAYPTREWTIDHAALSLASHVDREVVAGAAARSVSFVGIGTGSLIARYYLSHYELLPARRCVVVADASHPSDRYRSKRPGWLARRRYGVMLSQLAEGPAGFASSCGVPPVPYGVIVCNAAMPAGTDTHDHEVSRDSLYAPPYLLKDALASHYCPEKCEKAVRKPQTLDYIIQFLRFGYFRGNNA